MTTDDYDSIFVNGEPRAVLDGRRNLLSFLRYDVGLTGTKYGCGEGLCGSCTVLIDGQSLRACQTTVGAVLGGSAMQCGYCIPGFVMATVALLGREPTPAPDQIREALSENLCRCGAYGRIQRAVEMAARRLAEAGG
jgi:aerobic-type carbon monoxide dehydrogenase small subunit (CoxS/CutS family)